jgi:uncharacterized membrane protein YphA (DoxX/SURF4 family)
MSLWILQILLAIVFTLSGTMKLITPEARIRARLAAMTNLPIRVIRGIGLLEVLGAIGVVLPAATQILPWLTPLAAAGLALTMIGAAFANYATRHYAHIALNAALLVLALIVVYGRVAAA